MEVIARIDANTPTGRKIIRHLEAHKKTVKLEYPMPKGLDGHELYNVEEVFGNLRRQLKDYYGVK